MSNFTEEQVKEIQGIIESTFLKITKDIMRANEASTDGLKAQTITGFQVTSKQQRGMNKQFASYQNGVLADYEQMCNVKAGTGANEVVVEKGLVSCGGLILEVENEIILSSSGVPVNTKCIVVAEGNLDVEGTDPNLINKSVVKIMQGTTTEYPTLQKNNMTEGISGINHTELARFNMSSGGGVVFDKSNVKVIENMGEVIEAIQNNKQDIVDPQKFIGDNGITIEKKNGSSSVTISSFDTGFQIKNKAGSFLNLNDSYNLYTNKGYVSYVSDNDKKYVKKQGDTVSDEAIFKNSKNAQINFDGVGVRLLAPETGNWLGVNNDKTVVNSVKSISYYAKEGHIFTGGNVNVSNNLDVDDLISANQVEAKFGYRGNATTNNFNWLSVFTGSKVSHLFSTVQDNYLSRGQAFTYEVEEGSTRRVSFVHAEKDSPGWYWDGGWKFPQWVGTKDNMWHDLKAELTKTRANHQEPMDAVLEAIDNLARKEDEKVNELIKKLDN